MNEDKQVQEKRCHFVGRSRSSTILECSWSVDDLGEIMKQDETSHEKILDTVMEMKSKESCSGQEIQ